MSRSVESPRMSSEAAKKVEEFFPETIIEIRKAIDTNAVVVVGMAQNPHVKKVRAALTEEPPFPHLQKAVL